MIAVSNKFVEFTQQNVHENFKCVPVSVYMEPDFQFSSGNSKSLLGTFFVACII